MMRMPHYSSREPAYVSPTLLRGLHPSGRRRCATLDPPLGLLLLQPQTVMLLRPVEVDRATAHRLERTFHADRADIDVAEHRGDEQHRHDTMHDLRQLHAPDVGRIEREQQQIAAR